MARVKSAVGTSVHREGSQNQQILENFWGNGKTFTTEDLTADLDILSRARLTELRENGFDVRVVDTNNEGVQGRSLAVYKIMKKRIYA